MRARLLDATIDCLAELGWARTSLPEVVRKAGVARGAQVHHFPTKGELVVAAAAHLIERQRREYEAAFEALPPEARTIDAAIEVLWEILQGPTWTAELELVVAARTDERVRGALGDVVDKLSDLVVDVFARYFPDLANHSLMPVAVRGFVASIIGLALLRGVDGDRHGHHAEVLTYLKALGRNLTTLSPMFAIAEGSP